MALGTFAQILLGVLGLVFDQLLCIVPGAAGVVHEYRQQLPGEDDARQEAAQRIHAQQQAQQDRREHTQQGQRDELFLRRLGGDVDRFAIVRLHFASQHTQFELAAAFFHDQGRGAADRLDGKRREQPG